MNGISTDALADQNYRPGNPEYADVEQEERESIIAALDEVLSSLESTVLEFKAIRENFTTRTYNRFIQALEEIEAEVEEAKSNV